MLPFSRLRNWHDRSRGKQTTAHGGWKSTLLGVGNELTLKLANHLTPGLGNDLTPEVLKNLDFLGVDYMIPIGGDDTLSYGLRLYQVTLKLGNEVALRPSILGNIRGPQHVGRLQTLFHEIKAVPHIKQDGDILFGKAVFVVLQECLQLVLTMIGIFGAEFYRLVGRCDQEPGVGSEFGV